MMTILSKLMAWATRAERPAPWRLQAGFYNLDLMPILVGLVLVGALIGAVLTEGLPWAWSLIKPWLHEVTR